MHDRHVFSSQVGQDTYYNPWWGLETLIDLGARELVEAMAKTWGQPDIWFHGGYHELLWGPRDIHRRWRPGFHVNLSGTNNHIWRSFWLPWRGTLRFEGDTYYPYASNVSDNCVILDDIKIVPAYNEFIPHLRLPGFMRLMARDAGIM